MSTTCHLKAYRNILFFTTAEAATLIGGCREKDWQEMEAGQRAVPTDVEKQILDLIEWRQNAINAVSSQILATPGSPVNLIIFYETLDEWASLPGREPTLWRPHQSVCASLLAMHPDQTRLIAFNGPAYASWLADRPDSEKMRALWATHADRENPVN